MTDMTPFQQQMPAYLQQAAGQDLDEFEAGVAGGMPLPMMSFRGKEWRVRKSGQEYNTRQRDLQLVLVASRPYVSKRYFAESYSSGETSGPDCSSVDGQTPDVPEPINPKCATCPMNVWGSQVTASGKNAKACNDFKRLVVLPIIQGQALQEPAVLDVPATSLKTPRGYQGNDLFLREYMALLKKHGIPPYGVVTQVGFTDAEYPQLQFQLSHYVSEAVFNHVVSLREADDVREVLDAPVHEAPGTVAEASDVPTETAQAAPQPVQEAPQPAQPAAQPAPAADAGGNMTPEPAAQEAPAPDPLPEQEQPAPQPAAAAPEVAPTQGGNDDSQKAEEGNILDELDGILGG